MKMKLENRQIAVYTALILAFIMLFLPGSSSNRYMFKPEELAASIIAGEDQVRSSDLAEWLIQGRSDLYLIDIRNEEDFTKGAIKSAVNIPLSRLLERSTIDTEIPGYKTVILYSNGNTNAHQAWLVLKTAGVSAYVLQGGYNGWVETVLSPSKTAGNTDDEILKYETAKAVAGAFGSTGSVSEADNEEVSDKGDSKTPIKPLIKPKKKKLAGCG